MSISSATWRHEFIATHPERSEPTVLDGADFAAIDADDAKRMLARVVCDPAIRARARPHAIRLLDPDGGEVWRGLLAGPSRPQSIGATAMPA